MSIYTKEINKFMKWSVEKFEMRYTEVFVHPACKSLREEMHLLGIQISRADNNDQTINGPKQRRMATLNMPKVLTQEMATLIFNERCEINIDDDELADNIEGIFKDNKFNKHFQDYLEYQFTLGGMVVNPDFQDL